MQGAQGVFRDAIRRDPKDVGSVCGLAELLLQTADYVEARRLLLKALAIRPQEEAVLLLLSAACGSDGRVEEALEYADRAHAAHPNSAESARVKAEALRATGEYERAYELLRPIAGADGAPPALVLSYARLCKRFDGIERAIDLAQGVVDRAGDNTTLRAQAGFQLGGFLDSAGRYDDAMAAYRLANELSRNPDYSVEETIERFDRMIEAWDASACATAPASDSPIETPTFVVGKPRSGTTLVERIIGAHPLAHPGGERQEITEVARHIRDMRGNFMFDPSLLKKADLTKHARLVDRKMRAAAPKGAARIVDKMPTNYLRLHLISKMFPKARIIHTVRDPRDTCLSCYFHSFTGAYPYAQSLSDLGAYYRAYQRYTSHFIETLELDVLEAPYEEIVADQEGWSRKIIEHVGLDWHDDCLKFYENAGTSVTSSNEQVRKPIYTSSVGRWKNYEKHLGPLFEALGDSI